MKKTTLLATTALFAGFMALSAPAHAEEQGGWFQSMKQSVSAWFQPEAQNSAEVEAYLDEVTVAVPPMTGDDAAAIEPAAGGTYVEGTGMQTPVPGVAPGSMQYNSRMDETSSFGGVTVEGNQGGSIAFGDTPENLANIAPAAGDAEEITDESVVVAEQGTETEAEVGVESGVQTDAQTEQAVEATDEVAAETETQSEAASETGAGLGVTVETDSNVDAGLGNTLGLDAGTETDTEVEAEAEADADADMTVQ